MRSRVIKSILLLSGSFCFAFLVGEAIHELGHFLAHSFYGTGGIKIHLDPFGGSRILGVKTLPLQQMGVTSAAGPVVNLGAGLLFTTLLWRSKKPILLPISLWGPVAAVQEGVNFTLGMLTPGGDSSWIIQAGIPRPALFVFGIVLLLAGVVLMAALLPVAGLGIDLKFGARYLALLAGVGMLMAIRAVFSLFTSTAAAIENIIPLVFSIVLSSLVILVQRMISMINSKWASQNQEISWTAVFGALALAGAAFLSQIALP